MNRRQFIQRFVSAIALSMLELPRLRDVEEMPVILGNRSVFATLWDNWGIKSGAVRARAAKLNKRPSLVFDPYAVVGDGWSLDNRQTTAGNLAQFTQALAQQDPSLSHLPLPDSANIRRMNRIIADNPGMTKEQAFLEAVTQRAEAVL